jgi:tripartite-type tricarboxylate transporter receptor subunit TctC
MRRLIYAVGVALLALSHAVFAQSYPTKSIRLVVPFGPGGSADAIARPLADKLGTALGQTVVVDNRPGGLTVIGADIVAKAAPDGYTLYLMPGTHVLTPFLVQKVPFNAIADFTPIAMLGSQPYMIFANPQQPFATFAEMITYARANPGKLSMGVSDAVTLVTASTLKAVAKADINIISYKGGGPQNNDLLGNQIGTAVVTPNLMPLQRDGKLRALAATTPTRLPFLPDTPTIAESIAGSNFDIHTWYAVAGPANMPRAIVERLHAEIAKLAAEGDMRKRLNDLGMVPPADTRPEATLAAMKGYQERMGKHIEAAGVKPE